MILPESFPAKACLGALAIGALAGSSCSLATKTVTTSVSAAGQVATGTTKAALSTSGKVAGTAAKTSGTVAKTTVKAAAGVAATAVVVFKDTATGTAKEIPWKEGLKLYAASKTANLDLYLKAFQVIRQGQGAVYQSDWRKRKNRPPDPVLQPGDLIEVSRLATPRR